MKRPSSITRPSGLSHVSDANSSNSSTVSYNSSVISRPSLLSDIRLEMGQRMQAPWKVNDASLRPVPPFYPPLCPTCTVIITDSSPSVVASRISDCLTKRSISVEYDEETKSAACVTVDRVHFGINLFRGRSRTRTLSPSTNPETATLNSSLPPDLSHAVIVEIMRYRGSNLTFHHHCRAILNAAMGHSTGMDDRRPVTTSPLEFPRLEQRGDNTHKETRKSQNDCKISARKVVLTRQALEHAMSLLKKDRLGAQRLGMESLVCLTDVYSSGKDIALEASLILLTGAAPIMDSDEDDDDQDSSIVPATLKELNTYIVRLVQDRILPGDSMGSILDLSVDASIPTSQTSEYANTTRSTAATALFDDAHHGGWMRSMALRVLANSLTVLSERQSHDEDAFLSSILEHSPVSSLKFTQSLVEDLLGGTRLPAVVAGTRLASAHEATLATRCLGMLAQHCPSNTVRRWVNGSDTTASTSPTWHVLQQNLQVRHDALEQETRVTMAILMMGK